MPAALPPPPAAAVDFSQTQEAVAYTARMESQNPIIQMEAYAADVAATIAGASVDINAEGSTVEVRVVSEQFAGQSTVQRHRMVYKALNQHIQSGAIHALVIKALTPEEAQAAQ